MLASGVLLMLVAGTALVHSSEAARQRAAWAAERDAQECARALRSALQTRTVLAHCRPEQRFTIVDGSPELDQGLTWLHEHRADRDPVLRERLRQAQLAEFVAGDAGEAERLYDELLRDLPASSVAKADVQLLAAWQAHRAGRCRRRDDLRRAVRPRLAEARTDQLHDAALTAAIASLVLLDDRCGTTLAEPLSTLLAHAPTALARPALERLGMKHPVDPAIQPTRREHLRLARHREVLQRAARFVREAAHRGSPQRDDDDLVLWFDDDPDGQSRGEGAVVPVSWLTTLFDHDDPALPPVPRRGQLVLAADATPSCPPVVVGLVHMAPLPPPPLPWFSRPTTLLATGTLLLLLFVGSAWTTVRGVLRANATMRARTEFLTGVTHELKTPIAAMRLIADVLQDDRHRLSEDQKQRHLSMLTGEAARLTTLIDNVLDLGQIERGERAYDLRPDCAADAVRETVHGYRALAAHHGLGLELKEGMPAAPATIDRGAIAQALRNLLENARKYAPAGERVIVTTGLRGDTFVVCVRDHGPGVPAGEREAIFGRFVRGRAWQHGSVPGVGLGLFLSREIAHRHGGDLVHRQPDDGPGAIFELSLPLATAAAPPPTP